MSTFTYTPDYSAKKSVRPEVRKTEFQGYAQRVSFGIHTQIEEWNLTFAYRTDTEANAIVALFEAAAGVNYLTWTPPSEATAKKYIASEWDRTRDKPNLSTVTVKFSQVFDP